MPDFYKDLQVVFIELTSRCNLSCKYCSRGKWGNREYKDMSLATLHNILEKLPKKQLTICPYLAGEPLINTDFIDLIWTIKQSGYDHKIRFHTNAVLLSQTISEKLINSGITDIIFSIDGTDKNDYQRIRSVSFDNVKQNISKFFEINKGRLRTGVQNLIPYNKPLELNKDLLDLKDQFDEIIIEHPHSWTNFGKIPETYEPEYKDIPCFFLKYYMVISASGNYLPCCCCLNEEMILGNIKDRNPKEIWDNEMQLLRDSQINNRYIELCSKCKRYGK